MGGLEGGRRDKINHITYAVTVAAHVKLTGKLLADPSGAVI